MPRWPPNRQPRLVRLYFGIEADPIKLGLVTSFNPPGRNIIGYTSLTNVLKAKGLQLLHELVPQATLIAAPFNPSNRNAELGRARQLKQPRTRSVCACLCFMLMIWSNLARNRSLDPVVLPASRIGKSLLVGFAI